MNRNPAITPPSSRFERRRQTPPASCPAMSSAGRYRMIARLGKGGMGEVWRADDLVLETPVALKLIYSADPEARKRILDEVRLARQITHPAICRVFDVGEGEGEVFYSMELVHGEDLATLIRRVGRLPGREGHRHRPAALRWARGGPRAGHPAPRSEARERPHRRGRARADHRLRHRGHARCRRQRDADRHATLHGARAAGGGHAAVGANRYLRARPDSLRAARRAARV